MRLYWIYNRYIINKRKLGKKAQFEKGDDITIWDMMNVRNVR